MSLYIINVLFSLPIHDQTRYVLCAQLFTMYRNIKNQNHVYFFIMIVCSEKQKLQPDGASEVRADKYLPSKLSSGSRARYKIISVYSLCKSKTFFHKRISYDSHHRCMRSSFIVYTDNPNPGFLTFPVSHQFNFKITTNKNFFFFFFSF